MEEENPPDEKQSRNFLTVLCCVLKLKLFLVSVGGGRRRGCDLSTWLVIRVFTLHTPCFFHVIFLTDTFLYHLNLSPLGWCRVGRINGLISNRAEIGTANFQLQYSSNSTHRHGHIHHWEKWGTVPTRILTLGIYWGISPVKIWFRPDFDPLTFNVVFFVLKIWPFLKNSGPNLQTFQFLVGHTLDPNSQERGLLVRAWIPQ